MWRGCYGPPTMVGDLEELPTARELSFNVIKLTERIAAKWLKAKRIKLEGTRVLLDGQPLYDRRDGCPRPSKTRR